MIKHIEMIIDYIIDGDNLQYSDNHGRLTRCMDCTHANGKTRTCTLFDHPISELDYCSHAQMRVRK